MTEKNFRICSVCEDEFDPRARRPGFQWANRCNECNDHDDEGRDTIQAQTERIVRGQMTRAILLQQQQRKLANAAKEGG